ncbi:MAG: hypothetical protein ACOYU2_10485 [Nitrospirota bacterium]
MTIQEDIEPAMTFEKLNDDTHCDCLKDAEGNYDDTFSRRINKGTLRDKDFVSKWEKGQRPEGNDCKDVCSFKGISVNLYKNNHDSIIKKYIQSFKISPGYRAYCCMFRFKKNSGKVKHTPGWRDDSHYDFFKCDSFSINDIEVVQCFSLSEHV